MSEGSGAHSRPSSYSRRSSYQSGHPGPSESRYGGSSQSHQHHGFDSRRGSSISHPNVRDSRYSSSRNELSPISPGFSDHSPTSPLMPPSPAYSPPWGRMRSPSPGQTAASSPQDTFGLHTPTTTTMLAQGLMPDQPRVPSMRSRSSDSDLQSDPMQSKESIPLARPDQPPDIMRRSVESVPLSGGAQSQRSSWQRSSWQHASTVGHSDASIEHARMGRVSQNPPEPGRPYQPGRFSPIPPLPEVASLLSSMVVSESESNSPKSVEPAADSSSGAETSSQLAAMSQQSHHMSSQQSHHMSQQSQRTRSPLPPADVPVTPELEGISQAVTTPSYNAASAIDLRRYSFLDVDPTEVSTPARGGGVSSYSSPNIISSSGNRLSVPSNVYGGHRISAISGTTGSELSGIITFGGSPYGPHSDLQGDSSGSSGRPRGPYSDDSNNRFGLGPPIPWGKRDSATPRSGRSGRSLRRNGNGNGREKPMPPLPTNSDEEIDSELFALASRAAAVERMLQAGKRASLMTTKSFVNRWSMSTRMSTTSKRRKHRSATSSDSPHRRLSEKSSASTSHSTSQRKSNVSARSSFRRRLQRRFLSAGGSGSDSPTPSQQGLMDDDDPVNQLFDIEDASERSSITPRRRAISSNQQGLSELAEGEGTGVIVFPELAVAPRHMSRSAPPHDGEVCAQACLPPSVAVPYRPLPRDYHTGGGGGGGGGGWGGGGGGGGSSWSLASWRQPLRNLRAPQRHGEKTWEEYEQGLLPGCDVKPRRRNRRTMILVVLFCLVGVAIIAGLLGGLLSQRHS